MKKFNLILIVVCFFNKSYGEQLNYGQKYKITKPIYLVAEFKNRRNKSISKESAKAYLGSFPRAQMTYTAFQTLVPVGTVMTVISRAPKAWYLYFQGDIYFVKLDPDISQGLEITMQIDRGMEGNLDGLNPEIFSRM